MKRLLVFLFYLALSGFIGCTNEQMVGEPVTNTPDPYLITQAEALRHLENALAGIDTPQTRSSPRTVQSLTAVSRADLGMAATRAGESAEEPCVYIASFGEGEGSAVLAADRRLEPVIAIFDTYVITEEELRAVPPEPEAWRTLENLYCEEDDEYYLGAMNPPDGFDGNDLALYMLADYVDAELKDEGGGAVYEVESGWETTESVRPMLKTYWHQDDPFLITFHFPPIFGAAGVDLQFPPGCVTIAVAQIMAYHEFPSDYCDWALAKQYKKGENYPSEVDTELAGLVQKIASGCKIKANYLDSGQSFSTPRKAKKFLSRVGYGGVDKFNRYTRYEIVEALNAGCPVFIGALDTHGYGHAWVIDGYVRFSNTIETYCVDNLLETRVEDRYFVHCNWGWGDHTANGYYANNVFNTAAGPAPKTEEDIGLTRGSTGNYDWWFRIITYNKPN